MVQRLQICGLPYPPGREAWQLAAEQLADESYGLWQRDEGTERLHVSGTADMQDAYLEQSRKHPERSAWCWSSSRVWLIS